MFSLTENVFAIFAVFPVQWGPYSLPWGVKFWQFRRFGGVPWELGGGEVGLVGRVVIRVEALE